MYHLLHKKFVDEIAFAVVLLLFLCPGVIVIY